MGKSSGLVTHMTGFDSRVRIDSGCSAVAARRVRDPEDTGSIPVTLTRVVGSSGPSPPVQGSNSLSAPFGGPGVVAPIRSRATGCQPGGCGFESRLRRPLPRCCRAGRSPA